MSTIGDNIRNIRKRKGMTQEELAMQIGVTAQAISRWESGAGLPDISMIVPLAQVLTVSTDTLFGVIDNSYDKAFFYEIKESVNEMFESEQPYESLMKICGYLLERLQENPANYDVATLLVEKTGDLSRYAGEFSKAIQEKNEKYLTWQKIRDCAMRYGMQVIRFSNQRQLEERVHFAMAWIYMHDHDYVSAQTHVEALPSVASDRLQERLQGFLAFYEHGFDRQKAVVMKNLQNFIMAFNKELIYLMQNYCSKAPEEAVEFSRWAIEVIRSFMKMDYMRVACSGIVRDMHKYTMRAYLKRRRIDEAVVQYKMLQEDMRSQYEHFQKVLADEQLLAAYDADLQRHMENYTPAFMEKRQQEIINQLKRWHAAEVYEEFAKAVGLVGVDSVN